MEEALKRLSYLLETIPTKLNSISEEEFSFKSSPDKWSKKEILGHLIDSATINLQRVVRGQFEQVPTIGYDQDKWNQFSFHQQIESPLVISFWTAYNKQLFEIINRVPKKSLTRKVKVGNEDFTLEFIIIDYVTHLEHHLRQLVAY